MAGTSKNKRNSSANTRRSTKNTKNYRNTKSKKRGQEAEESFIRGEVMIIGSVALAILLFLSNFHLCGAVGDVLRGFMLGMFGGVGYLVPVFLCVGVGFYFSNRGNVAAAVKLAAAVAAVLVLCGLDQMILGSGYSSGWKLTAYYNASTAGGVGGGLLGGLLAAALGTSLGTVGAYVILLVLLVICLVCITEKSVVKVVKKGGDKAYQYAKEDLDRRKELRAERAEERKRLREEQRVRGVNLASTNLLEEEADAGRLEPVEMEKESGQRQEPENPADVFRGRIARPEPADAEYVDAEELDAAAPARMYSREDEEVPFDEEDIHAQEIFPVHSLVHKEEEEYGGDIYMDEPDEEPAALAEGLVDGAICVAEGTKTVVTAGGKIIEKDTELLRKKLEGQGGGSGAPSIPNNTLAPGSGQALGAARAEQARAGQTQPSGGSAAEKPAPPVKKEYVFPPISLLKRGERKSGGFSDKEYKETAIKLQQILKNFGVGVTVTNVSCGPSVTRYELHPEQGVKVSKIVSLTDDIKLNLAAADIRIEAPIPGKAAVGIEVPNKENNTVLLRDLLESEEFKKHPSRIAFAVGKDIAGQTVVTDIAKMPHLLIAGATGSGKSVCINTLIMSIIYKSNPEDVKLIMIDPKVVELSVYNGIPHLLIPVVTDPKKASGALNWAVAEMMDRYKKFADYNVRDLKGYNEKIKNIEDIEDENKPQKLPQIIIIVDELADLMMVAPGEVEDAICRLAQLARAAGIHLVIATQRPSVNVITGLIKANVPSRIAFSVSSGVDSRTIIDMNGAEKLLGKGDMLFYPSGFQKPQRVQGAFVSDQEVSRVVEFLTKQELTSEYSPDIEAQIASAPAQADASDPAGSRDDYFVQAGRFIIEKDKASIGMLQRMFKIGFNRAARIMDQLAEAGVVGEEEGTKPRKILMTMEQFDELVRNGV